MASDASDDTGRWACACVRRDRQGRMTHIKTHAPTERRCRVCMTERPADDAADPAERRPRD